MWCKMLFGLKKVSTHFQQIAKQIVGKAIEFTRVYVDNFLIYFELVKKHIKHLLIKI
jgi:hypothetical protein